jgi:arylsulfatase A-like enzyme
MFMRWRKLILSRKIPAPKGGRESRILFTAFALLCFWLHLGVAAPPSPAERHALVISIDGLGASWYVSPPPELRIPNLRRLMQEGSYAEGVEGVYPSVTYPSHTTLSTGRLPREHGIYGNLSSRQAGKNTRDWYWFTSAIRVPALWDEVRRAGLKSGAVSWPVSVGAPIDWNVPEYWDPAKGEHLDLDFLARHATPGLVEEATRELGAPSTEEPEDVVRARFAAYVLKKYKPHLLLVHLIDLDGAEHSSGPTSPEAVAAVERADGYVGELLAAVREAGLADSTDVFIVSDHGFLPVEREIRPNVLLAKAGLIDVDELGNVSGGKVLGLANGGSFFLYWPEGEDYRARVNAALEPLRAAGVLWGELGREALAELGAEPAIQMALEAPSGAAFSGRATGEVVVKKNTPGGTHGYLPFRAGLEAAFIAWGPRIKPGVCLRRIRMTAVAPTVLRSLGIENPLFGAHPPLNEMFK